MSDPVVVRGRTLAETIAAAPKRRTGFIRPTRLDRAVYNRHSKWGAGFPLHEYGVDGRCTIVGCDVFDATEGDSLAVSD